MTPYEEDGVAAMIPPARLRYELHEKVILMSALPRRRRSRPWRRSQALRAATRWHAHLPATVPHRHRPKPPTRGGCCFSCAAVWSSSIMVGAALVASPCYRGSRRACSISMAYSRYLMNLSSLGATASCLAIDTNRSPSWSMPRPSSLSSSVDGERRRTARTLTSS